MRRPPFANSTRNCWPKIGIRERENACSKMVCFNVGGSMCNGVHRKEMDGGKRYPGKKNVKGQDLKQKMNSVQEEHVFRQCRKI